VINEPLETSPLETSPFNTSDQKTSRWRRSGNTTADPAVAFAYQEARQLNVSEELNEPTNPASFTRLKKYLKQTLRGIVLSWQRRMNVQRNVESRNKQKAALDELDDLITIPIAFVVEESVSSLLSTIVGMSYLRQHGVKDVFHLAPRSLNTKCPLVIYVIRPRVASIKTISVQIHQHFTKNIHKQYGVLFVPKESAACMRELEQQGLYGHPCLFVGQLPIDLVPLDVGVASLERSSAFKDCYLYQDRTILHDVASSLYNLQRLYGVIPRIIGKGQNSMIIKNMLVGMTKASNVKFHPDSIIKELILIDRDIDLLTPMLTSLTYQGMIDEIYGISVGFIKIKRWLMGDKSDKKDKITRYRLSSDDSLFAQMRDQNMPSILHSVKNLARDVREKFRSAKKARSIKELRTLVKKVPNFMKEKVWNELRAC